METYMENEFFMLSNNKTYKENELFNFSNNKKYLNPDFTVSVGEKIQQTYIVRVSKYPFNRVFCGHQRSIEQTEEASVVSFFGNGETEVTVQCKKIFKKCIIRPAQKNIQISQNGNEMTFTLPEYGQYVLELDSYHEPLFIFYNKDKPIPKREDVTYYYGPGIHFGGRITLRSNESLYVDRNAVVFANLFAENAENVRVFGGGTIDGGAEERVTSHIYGTKYEDFVIGNLKLRNCKNVNIEDVIFTNSATFCVSAYYCRNICFDNIKVVGQWRYNSDGIDLINTSDSVIRNSFVRSFDDTVCVKGISDIDVIENITVDNCVLWCDWGRTCEIGAETACNEIRNIKFLNSFCIHNIGAYALDIQNCNYADVHSVIFENMSVEFQKNSAPRRVLQSSDTDIYPGGDDGLLWLLNIDNGKNYGTEGFAFSEKKTKEFGMVKNIKYNNIYVISDDDQIRPTIEINSKSDNVIFDRIEVKNLFINGKKVSDINAGFDLKIQNAENTEI